MSNDLPRLPSLPGRPDSGVVRRGPRLVHSTSTSSSTMGEMQALQLPRLAGSRHRRTASDPLAIRELLDKLPECGEDEEAESAHDGAGQAPRWLDAVHVVRQRALQRTKRHNSNENVSHVSAMHSSIGAYDRHLHPFPMSTAAATASSSSNGHASPLGAGTLLFAPPLPSSPASSSSPSSSSSSALAGPSYAYLGSNLAHSSSLRRSSLPAVLQAPEDEPFSLTSPQCSPPSATTAAGHVMLDGAMSIKAVKRFARPSAAAATHLVSPNPGHASNNNETGPFLLPSLLLTTPSGSQKTVRFALPLEDESPRHRLVSAHPAPRDNSSEDSPPEHDNDGEDVDGEAEAEAIVVVDSDLDHDDDDDDDGDDDDDDGDICELHEEVEEEKEDDEDEEETDDFALISAFAGVVCS